MKYLKIIFFILSGLCFFEVYYLHSKLSFIDTPYLYGGFVFLIASALLHYFSRKTQKK